MMFIQPISFTALNQRSSRQHAAPSAFSSSLIQFLGNVSGRNLQDYMPATQFSGKFRIPRMAPNGFHISYTVHSHLILGFNFFLSCHIIEDSLHKTYHDRVNHPPAVFGATINDIQGSPAWNDILGFLQSPYHLLFGIYIDWYNPHAVRTEVLLSGPQGQRQPRVGVAKGGLDQKGLVRPTKVVEYETP